MPLASSESHKYLPPAPTTLISRPQAPPQAGFQTVILPGSPGYAVLQAVVRMSAARPNNVPVSAAPALNAIG